MALVKAEAYGHGLVRVSQEFAALGADYLGVSFLEEGVALREAGLDTPILVLGGLVDEQIDRYLDFDLEITVSSVWKARQVEAAAAARRMKAVVHLKVDTGMGRIGQQWQTAGLLFGEAVRMPHIEVLGIYTHLAASEAEDLSFARTQLGRFSGVIEAAHKAGLNPPLVHIACSGALFQLPDETRFTMVRPGLMLYGYAPAAHLEGRFDLRPVMALKSRVVFVKRPPAGTTIGYGATWRSPGDRWIATVPIGYGDGYPRRAGNRGWVILRGRRCPVVGKVSMDQITVDAGPEAYLGDEVLLFGGGDDQELPLWELCRVLDAIPYELLCGLTARVPRVLVD